MAVFGFEAEVVVLPVHEERIGDEAVLVPAFGLPGGSFVERGTFGEADVADEDVAVSNTSEASSNQPRSTKLRVFKDVLKKTGI